MIIDLSNPTHLFAASFIVVTLMGMTYIAIDSRGKVDPALAFIPWVAFASFCACAATSLFQLIIKSL